MLRTGLFLAACGIALSASPSFAQEISCHESASHAVTELPNADVPGTSFLVTAASVGCVDDVARADIVIGDGEDPLWFAQLHGDKLVLTRSTGPQGDLVVHDLSSNARLLDVPADEFEVEGNELVYWERTAPATAETCPQFQEYEAEGFGSVIAEEKRLAFADTAPVATGRTRCDATQ